MLFLRAPPHKIQNIVGRIFLTGLSRNGQFLGLVLVHSYPSVRVRELTREQLACVQCPTCGVPAGKRCERYSGALRKEPHVDRKLSAVEAIERKRVARRA